MTDEPRRLHRIAELAEAGLAAASLAHEIRQPLFAIKAMAQLSGPDGIPADQVKELLIAVRHIEQLLDAWRGIGREEAARLYDLGAVAREVGALLAPRANDLDAVVRIEASGPVWVEGLPSVGRQVLLNLLQNSLDAIEGCEDRCIDVGFLRADDLLGVEVRDTGSGIEPAVASRLFQPFVTTKGQSGTGLGLYVCQNLCVAEGGSVEVASGAGGTVVRARFAQAVEPLSPRTAADP